MDLLKEVNQTGIAMIIVTHENEIAAQTRRIIRLRDGIIESDEENAAFQHEGSAAFLS
jgi:putative ABC transport system ATP-binding protein